MGNQLSREEIISVLRKQKDLLRDKFYVTRIGIFGSFARNEARPDSDIDFLVEFNAPLPQYIANRYALSDYLQSLFLREIDLANPKSLKPFYKERIAKDEGLIIGIIGVPVT